MKTLKRRQFLNLAASALALPAIIRSARADTYPSRPIHLIVGFPPGGTADILARLTGSMIQERLGQPIVVENRPGAGSTIGTADVAKAKPDGYTLLMAGTGAMAISPTLYKTLPYDPQRDFVPVALIAKNPFVLVINPSLPVHSVPELIAYAKDHPLTYGSGGIGSPHQLFAEMFKTMTGVNMTHVPYKGTAPALTDLMAGHISLLFADIAPTLPLVAAGKIRALGETSAAPLPSAPDIPPLREAGVPGFDAAGWGMVVAPARTPEAVIAKLYEAFRTVLADDTVRAKMITLGMVPQSSPPPARLPDFIAAERARWSQVVKDAGLAGTE